MHAKMKQHWYVMFVKYIWHLQGLRRAPSTTKDKMTSGAKAKGSATGKKNKDLSDTEGEEDADFFHHDFFRRIFESRLISAVSWSVTG